MRGGLMISRMHTPCAAVPARGVCGLLSSNLIHRPLRLHELVAIDSVAGLLVPNTVANQIGELLIAPAGAKDCAGVPLHHREQAVADFTFRGETKPVAVLAEGLRDGIDKPNHSAVGIGKITRRLAGVGTMRRGQRANGGFDLLPN